MEVLLLHHLGIFASDFEVSRSFYAAALGGLGIIAEYETAEIAEFWRPDSDTPSLSLERATGEVTRSVHLAFSAEDRASVDEFFRAALSAGGLERNAPRFWSEYRAYCAFVTDPDGNNIEAVHKEIPDRELP
jgi:catechol 2,3-dioxygenase-like lactoylglutathione lyase family enzyme